MSDYKNGKYVYIIILLILVCGYIFILNIAPVNADYGYYVGVAKGISQGMVPYRDMSLWYTPFVFYLLGIPYMFCGINISPLVPMYIAFLFNLMNGFLIWLIMRDLKIDRTIQRFSICLYILYLFSVESVFLGLEPFATFWGLLGTYVLMKRCNYSTVIGGACLTVAFLCKQYALLYAPIYAILIFCLYAEEKMRVRILLVLQIAFSSLLLLLVVHFSFVAITGSGDYFMSLLGTGYGQRTIKGIIKVLQDRFFHLFFVILLIPFIWKGINSITKRRIFFLISAILILLLQNYYDIFPHYLIFIVPYVVLLVALLAQNVLACKKRLLFCIVVMLSAICFSVKAFKSYNIMTKDKVGKLELTRSRQFDVAHFLQTVIPAKSKTVVVLQWNAVVTPHLYGIIDIVPVDFQHTRFGFENETLLLGQVKNADVLVLEESHPMYDDFVQQFSRSYICHTYKGVKVFLRSD